MMDKMVFELSFVIPGNVISLAIQKRDSTFCTSFSRYCQPHSFLQPPFLFLKLIKEIHTHNIVFNLLIFPFRFLYFLFFCYLKVN